MLRLQRVLLLMSVAYFLQESSASSPLDFLRDIKNRIFAPSNATSSMEESSVQCSGSDQDGVCGLQETAISGSMDGSNTTEIREILNNTDFINCTHGSDNLEPEQFVGNKTNLEDVYSTNNTQYYDEQDWNNTVNYRNDFEYPENGQNETDSIGEHSPSGGDENNDQGRKKRQINPAERNTELETKGISIAKQLTLNTTVLTEKSDPVFTSVDNMLHDFSGSTNLTGEIIKNEPTSVNCTTCATLEEKLIGSRDIPLGFDQTPNGTGFAKVEDIKVNENMTHVNNKDYISILANITKLKDILDNSTQIIEKIVQNILPEMSVISHDTKVNQTIDSNQVKAQNVSLGEITTNKKEMERDKNYNGPFNPIIILTNTTGTDEGNEVMTYNTSNETFNNEIIEISGNKNFNTSQSLGLDLNDSVVSENNINHNAEIGGITDISTINSNISLTRDNHDTYETSVNNTSCIHNESTTTYFVKATEKNNTAVTKNVLNNETGTAPNDEWKSKNLTNITLGNTTNLALTSVDNMLHDFSGSQNLIEEIIKNEPTSINCTTCAAPEDKPIGSKDIPLGLDQNPNGTGFTKFEDIKVNENLTHVINRDYISNLTNITKLKDILDNSTRIIEKIVHNIVPEMSVLSQDTKVNQTIDSNQVNIQNVSLGEIKPSNKEIESDKNYNGSINPIISLTNTTGTDEESEIMTYNTSNEALNNEIIDISGNKNLNTSQSLMMNLNDSIVFENNVTLNVEISGSTNKHNIVNMSVYNISSTKREKRSINFTILNEEDEDEMNFSVSKLPESSESPATEVPSSVTLNSTESSSWNDTTQAIDVVGPVCIKRYEQCKNSKECCEDYECIGVEENNSTSYCDLRPKNLAHTISLPEATNNTV